MGTAVLNLVRPHATATSRYKYIFWLPVGITLVLGYYVGTAVPYAAVLDQRMYTSYGKFST